MGDRIDPAVEREFYSHRASWVVGPSRRSRASSSSVTVSGKAVVTERAIVPYTPIGAAGQQRSRAGGSSNRRLPDVDEMDISSHMECARAPSTNKKRGSVITRYVELCGRHAVESFPISSASLILFVVSLTKKALMYETVADYVNIVKVESRRYSEVQLSQTADEEVRLTLQAAKRLLGNRKKDRTVTLNVAQVRVLSYLTPESGRRRSTVAYLIGMMGLMRLKEVAALKLGDLAFGVRGDYVAIKIRSSKTDQSGVGRTIYIGCVSAPIPDSCTEHACAVHRLLRMIESFERLDRKDSLFGASYSQLSEDIKSLVTTTLDGNLDEEEAGKRTSHSMRRTGVRLLADAGLRLEDIADYGRWKDVRTVQNNYMRDASGRPAREKSYSHRMMIEVF
ncbi:hypothetical protein FOZ61_005014 [Perkinsus olseni]|uniref:Tyr recombinase domain-containing protein n=1 Tax=Perkinsus olseni TaxID=32597 RepID=A0A7J6LIJ0_PEROL|nr:hypothetical protein FOZ61_005014 [Perkinsus olseni]KAF4666248.1 hypothetical protein FOL46_003199 [Perkinsus olseni]